MEDAGTKETREAGAGGGGDGQGSPAAGRRGGGLGEALRRVVEALVATGGREEHRMGSVRVVPENNGDGQAPGGAARGTPEMNWWGGKNRGDEGKLVDSSGGEGRG